MGARQELEKRIEKKKAEIAEQETKLREEKAFLLGLQESLKYLPKDDTGEPKTETVLRPGTDLFKTREFLQKQGRPVYIMDILRGIGKEATKENRVSLSGNLSWYYRKGWIFTRPRPNTFGLIGMREEANGDAEGEVSEEESEEVDDENLSQT